jgi:uncharacterized membrane protein YoaK (UPF0700 family)
VARRWAVGALLLLTAATGIVDAVSYLKLGHVFVANMTGNVVFVGLSLYPHSGLSLASSAVAIAGFVVGSLAGGRAGKHFHQWPRLWLTGVFAAQAGIVAVLAALTAVDVIPDTRTGAFGLIAVLAACFGLQNATVRKLAPPDLTTTVLTLTITGLAADSTMAGGPGAKPGRRLGSIAAMLVGAGLGALLLRVTLCGTIAAAAALVAIAAATFRYAPDPADSAIPSHE